jgi:flagellar FliL protein
MKYTEDKPSRNLLIVQRILISVLILIILLILTGTIYAFISNTEETQADNKIFTSKGIFTGIGRIRAKSAKPQSAAVMITIAFPYDTEDISFSEELASKVAQFRSETNLYFQAYTTDELRLKTDEEIQIELLAIYNALLRLGSIDTLYITDYIVID